MRYPPAQENYADLCLVDSKEASLQLDLIIRPYAVMAAILAGSLTALRYIRTKARLPGHCLGACSRLRSRRAPADIGYQM